MLVINLDPGRLAVHRDRARELGNVLAAGSLRRQGLIERLFGAIAVTAPGRQCQSQRGERPPAGS